MYCSRATTNLYPAIEQYLQVAMETSSDSVPGVYM